MIELVYHSISTTNLDKDDLLAIQKISEDTNSKIGITGLLLYHKNEFVGILEGNEENVKELYSKIETDNRHKNILILAEGTLRERQFGQWKMISVMDFGALAVKADNDLLVENILGLAQLEEKRTNGSRLFWQNVEKMLKEKESIRRHNQNYGR